MQPNWPEPPARTGAELLERLSRREPPRHKGLRFSACKETGWLSGTAWAVSLCTSMWNMRSLIRSAVRLQQALAKAPDQRIRLMSGSCTCMTKSPLPEHHAQSCVYAAVRELETLDGS